MIPYSSFFHSFNLLLIILLNSGCKQDPIIDEWKNPEIYCNYLQDREEFFNPPNGEKTNENFMSFCDKMKENFSNSNLSEKEAERIYDFLYKNFGITDGIYDMPSIGDTTHTLTFNEYVKRVAIKKLKQNSTFEFYYYYPDCGYNFYYIKFELKKDIYKKVNEEYWWITAGC